MAYRSPWSFIAEAGQGVGATLMQLGTMFSEKQAVQGQQIKAQVGQQVGQMEAALADPNYKWNEPERRAAEAFVTQGRTLLAADDAAVPASYAEWQQRGIKVPGTTIKQGNAKSPMTAKPTLMLYQGGVAGFLGDVNQGVTQAGQEREQFEQEAEQLRQLQLLGKQNEYETARARMENRWGRERMEDEQLFAGEQANTTLDANASWQRASSFATQLQAVGDTSNPKNKQAAQRIMKNAKAAGLLPGDLQIVQGEFQALGSGTAALNFQELEQRIAGGALTNEQLAQQVGLNEQTLKLGEQELQLGQFRLGEAEYLQSRRPIEDFFEDQTAMREIVAQAVANGDDKYINDVLNTLQGGGAVNPQMYQALTSAGITAESLGESLTDATQNDAWKQRKDALDVAETDAAFIQLATNQQLSDLELMSAQNVFKDGVAKQYTPAEIDEQLRDPRSPLSTLAAQGTLTQADIKSMKRNASVYGVLRQDEVNAPRLERATGMLETLAAVPKDPVIAENALRSTLGTFIDTGVMSEEQAEGVVSSYRNAWEYGEAMQDSELASAEANRAYQAALTQMQTSSATGTAAEVGWTDETKAQWDAVQEGFDANREDIETQYPQCFAADPMAGSNPECARAFELVEDNRRQREAAVQGFLGAMAPQDVTAAQQDAFIAVEGRVRSDPAFQGLGEVAVMTEVNRRLVDRGYQAVPQAIMDAAGQADANAERAQPQAAPTGPRTLAGDVSAAGREVAGTTRQQLGEVGQVLGAVGNYVTGGGGAQAAPGTPTAITSTTGAGTVANLRADAEFTGLVNGLSEFGDMSAPQQQAVAQAIASRYGLTPGTVLQMAQQELLSTRANPTPAPVYRGPVGR